MPEQNPNHRNSYAMPVILVIVLLVLGGGGYFLWSSFSTPEPEPAPPEPVQQQPVNTDQTFASTTMRISVTYPQNFTLDSAYANTSVSPTKPILGVKFSVPVEMTTGTNLSPDSGISVEQLPRASLCTGDIYLAANVARREVTEGTVMYSLATSSEGAAGNFFEEMVYALSSSTPCTAVRYFIHTTNVENYATGTVREFDRAAVIAAFDKIRRSLVMQ
ncbi:MAG: hypothetical protein WA021_03215 [Minisyncoccia bacterium]